MSIYLDKALLGLAGAAALTGIDQLSQLIKTSISTARKPTSSLPPFYISIEDKMRPGLSAISLTSNIISRLGEVS